MTHFTPYRVKWVSDILSSHGFRKKIFFIDFISIKCFDLCAKMSFSTMFLWSTAKKSRK